MKTEDLIDKFAGRTHSPRGKYAAGKETYRELLNRLPENDRPAVSPEIAARKPVIGRRRRWSVAASAALILGVGAAIAAVVTFRAELFPTFSQTDVVYSPVEIPAAKEDPTAQLLVFENLPLKDIATELSEAYNEEIVIEDETLADYRITATFSTDEPLDEILDILTEAGNFSYTKVSGRVILRGN